MSVTTATLIVRWPARLAPSRPRRRPAPGPRRARRDARPSISESPHTLLGGAFDGASRPCDAGLNTKLDRCRNRRSVVVTRHRVVRTSVASAARARQRRADHGGELVLLDQHPAGLRALVAGDDPAPLEHVDQPAGAGVADAQPALEQRDGRGLRLHDDLDRLVEQRVLVGVEVAVVVAVVRRRSSPAPRAASRRAPGRAGARHCSTTIAISSSVTNAPWTRCRRDVPSGLKSMSPWPSRLSAPGAVEDHARVGLARDGERDPGRDVRLDHPGDHVDRRALRREHEVDPDGARLLGEPDDRVLDRLRRDHHQVGELVDHDEQVRQRVLPARPERAVRLGQVARADDREALVAALHLGDDVLQHGRGLLRARDDRRQEVRDRLVVVELDPLRVDQDHPHVVRRRAQQDRGQQRVDAARLPRAGRAGDQQVRHPREIGPDGVAGDVLAEPHRERARRARAGRRRCRRA